MPNHSQPQQHPPLQPTRLVQQAQHLDLQVDERFALLRTVATALIDLDHLDDLSTFRLPYPPEAQRALDRMVLACLKRRATAPRSVIDLVRWSRDRAVLDWPLDLPEEMFSSEDYLLAPESGRPTELCQELAVNGRDSAVEQYDQTVVHAAMRLCRGAGSQVGYVAFRRLLIDRPVLTSQQLFEVIGDLELLPVVDLLAQIYEPVPIGYRRDGLYQPCGRCRTLLTPLRDGGWWCERDVCRQQGGGLTGTALNADDVGQLQHLPRPLRQFVTGPGRAELDVADALRHLRAPNRRDGDSPDRLKVELWPEFDAYDLRITFPDGRVWAVDVKDWANPVLLGRKASRMHRTPGYDESFWVVPRHRITVRRDYLDQVRRQRDWQTSGLTLLTDEQLIARAKARLGDPTCPRGQCGHDSSPSIRQIEE